MIELFVQSTNDDGGRSDFLHASARYAADVLDGSRARPNLRVGWPQCYAVLGTCGTRNILFRRM